MTAFAVQAAAVLAHQGGWDEILMVLGPILLIAGLLRLAKHRVTRPGPPHDTAAADTSDGPTPG